ncbi:AAA family ATPase [Streptomyces sp. SID5475]|nr:AAA family ATPase [Streptomyces sp. SID5475]
MPGRARIGILGGPWTGKTTLARRITTELAGHGLRVERVGGLAKRAAAAGMPKMDTQTAHTTEWLMHQGLADETAALTAANVVLADGPVLGPLAYYTAALEHRGETPDELALDRLRLLASLAVPDYDLLIATVLDPQEATDSPHGDLRFQMQVHQHAHALLADLEAPHTIVENVDASQAAAVTRAVESALKAADR